MFFSLFLFLFRRTFRSSFFTFYSTLFILHSSFFTLRSSFFILHSPFFILHSSFFTLHSSFFTLRSSLYITECLVECVDQVVDVLYADAQANGGRINVLLLKLLWAQL